MLRVYIFFHVNENAKTCEKKNRKITSTCSRGTCFIHRPARLLSRTRPVALVVARVMMLRQWRLLAIKTAALYPLGTNEKNYFINLKRKWKQMSRLFFSLTNLFYFFQIIFFFFKIQWFIIKLLYIIHYFPYFLFTFSYFSVFSQLFVIY